MGIEECIPKGYIKIMEDMYRRAVTTVRMVSWAIFELPVGVGLHRRSTLRAHFGNYRFHGTRVSGNTQQSEPTPPCDLEVQAIMYLGRRKAWRSVSRLKRQVVPEHKSSGYLTLVFWNTVIILHPNVVLIFFFFFSRRLVRFEGCVWYLW